mgnify:CR=1 FL=1
MNSKVLARIINYQQILTSGIYIESIGYIAVLDAAKIFCKLTEHLQSTVRRKRGPD